MPSDLIGQAIAANDKIAAYHGGIAEAYRVLGRRDAAIEHYRKAVAIDPGYWAAHSMLADCCAKPAAQRPRSNITKRRVATKPDLASARHNLAALLLEQGRR